MAKKRLPAIPDRVVWEKVTKGRAEIRWERVVGEVWKDLGGNQEELLFIEKFGRYKKTKVIETIQVWERLARRKKVDGESFLKTYGGLKQEIGKQRTCTAQ